MSKVDEPEFFCCYICKKYISVKLLKEIAVKGFWHKKDICDECFKKINETKAEDIGGV